jgi:hypothetical protein
LKVKIEKGYPILPPKKHRVNFSLLGYEFDQHQKAECDKKTNKDFVTPFKIERLSFFICSVGEDYDTRKNEKKTNSKNQLSR